MLNYTSLKRLNGDKYSSLMGSQKRSVVIIAPSLKEVIWDIHIFTATLEWIQYARVLNYNSWKGQQGTDTLAYWAHCCVVKMAPRLKKVICDHIHIFTATFKWAQ